MKNRNMEYTAFLWRIQAGVYEESRAYSRNRVVG